MIIWLTGNTGAGKSTLAWKLVERIKPQPIVLDGDEMRHVWEDLGLSMTDRMKNNIRIAKLARHFNAQKFDVIVSVIAPTMEIRRAINTIIHPIWIYVRRKADEIPVKEKPYEIPMTVDFRVHPDMQTIDEEVDSVVAFLKRTRMRTIT